MMASFEVDPTALHIPQQIKEAVNHYNIQLNTKYDMIAGG